jgi:REP element-mobilizing transposase RayT
MAQQRTNMKIHFVVCMSNHIHLFLSPTDARQLAAFMEHFKSKLAREVNKLHGWEGPVFHGRYRAIPVSEEPEAQTERLRYLIAHGVKEDLVEDPLQWPGVHAVKHYVNGEPMCGVWIDRTAMARHPNEPEQHTRTLELRLDPLPGHEPEAFRELVRELLRQVVEEEGQRRRAEKRKVLGAHRVRKRHPHWRPPKLEHRPPPRIHAIREEVRRRYREALSGFLRAYRDAAERLKRGSPQPRFPPGCFPPAGPFVPLTVG